MSASLAVMLAITGSGCGTMISATKQKVTLTVNPPGSKLDVFSWGGERLAGPIASPDTLVVARPKGAKKEPRHGGRR